MTKNEKEFLGTVQSALKPPEYIRLDEWAEQHRILSDKHAEPGLFSFDRTPYLREIMHQLSPQSPTQKVVVMKAPQLGFTELAVTWVLYTIDINPNNMYYMITDLKEARNFSKTRFNREAALHPRVHRKLQTFDGRYDTDTMLLKQFVGGDLMIVGAQTPSAFRDKVVKLIVVDEVDKMPLDIDGEGDPIQLLENRQKTFYDKKMLLISTPTLHEERNVKDSEKAAVSIIYREFLKGDQRYFYMPCPFCEEKIRFEFDNLVRDKTESKIQILGMLCCECGEIIQEDQKDGMMKKGEWVAAKPELSNSKVASYHINGLYTPSAWQDWVYCAKLYYESVEDKNKAPNFSNNILALPFNPIISNIQPETLVRREEEYATQYLDEGTILNDENKKTFMLPEGAVLLTAGIDVQKDRLECSVWAWGLGLESWLISHHIITATNTNNINDACYISLSALLRKQYLLSTGHIVSLERAFIDSGYNTTTIFNYCKQSGYIVNPARGITRGMIEATESKKNNVTFYNVNVNNMKSIFFGYLEDVDVGMGHIHFPINQLNIEFYRQITAEYKSFDNGKEVWKMKRDRNEALDCRIYAQSAVMSLNFHIWNEENITFYLHKIGVM